MSEQFPQTNTEHNNQTNPKLKVDAEVLVRRGDNRISMMKVMEVLEDDPVASFDDHNKPTSTRLVRVQGAEEEIDGEIKYPSKIIPDTLLTPEVQAELREEAPESIKAELTTRRIDLRQKLGELGLDYVTSDVPQRDEFDEQSDFPFEQLIKTSLK